MGQHRYVAGGRKDRGSMMDVILYVKESIQAYEIKLEREADCDEAVWCKLFQESGCVWM